MVRNGFPLSLFSPQRPSLCWILSMASLQKQVSTTCYGSPVRSGKNSAREGKLLPFSPNNVRQCPPSFWWLNAAQLSSWVRQAAMSRQPWDLVQCCWWPHKSWCWTWRAQTTWTALPVSILYCLPSNAVHRHLPWKAYSREYRHRELEPQREITLIQPKPPGSVFSLCSCPELPPRLYEPQFGVGGGGGLKFSMF